MSKVKIEYNERNIGKLLKSSEMKSGLDMIANGISTRSGDGYEVISKNMPTRPIRIIETATREAMLDCEANNTLLKNLG